MLSLSPSTTPHNNTLTPPRATQTRFPPQKQVSELVAAMWTQCARGDYSLARETVAREEQVCCIYIHIYVCIYVYVDTHLCVLLLPARAELC